MPKNSASIAFLLALAGAATGCLENDLSIARRSYSGRSSSVELPSAVPGDPSAVASPSPGPSPSPSLDPSACTYANGMAVADLTRSLGPYSAGYAYGVAASGSGAVVVGTAYPNASGEPQRYEWTARRTQDAGASWQSTDQFRISDTSESSYGIQATSHPAGDVFVGGTVRGATGPRTVIRRSSFSGALWQTVDNVAGELVSLTSDVRGNVLSVTRATVGSTDQYLVRFTPDRGVNWFALDTLSYPVQTAYVDSNGYAYVAGSNQGRLTLRRSPDSGATWQTIADLDASVAHGDASWNALLEDDQKALYAVVGGSVILRSIDRGVAWSVVDDLRQSLPGYSNIRVLSLFRAPQGGVSAFAALSTASGYGLEQWTVRAGRGSSTWRTLASGSSPLSGAIFFGASANAAGDLYAVGYSGQSWMTTRLACRL